jgi:hypothetical protein
VLPVVIQSSTITTRSDRVRSNDRPRNVSLVPRHVGADSTGMSAPGWLRSLFRASTRPAPSFHGHECAQNWATCLGSEHSGHVRIAERISKCFRNQGQQFSAAKDASDIGMIVHERKG